MDIFNTPYLYAKKYVATTLLDSDIFVMCRYDGDRDDKRQNYIISVPDLIASIAVMIPGAGVTSVTLNNLLPLFTVSNTGTVTDPIFTFVAPVQSANLVYAGPAVGVPAVPTFRALTLADMPAGIDAQDLANVLGVGFTTGELPITSNNAEGTLEVKNLNSTLSRISGLSSSQFHLDDIGLYANWSNGTNTGSSTILATDLTILYGDGFALQSQLVLSTTYAQFYHSDNTLGGTGQISIDPSNLEVIHGTKLRLDAPLYEFTQLTLDTAVYIDATNNLVSIPFTANGEVFTLSGGIPTWAPLPGSTLATCQLDFYVTNINACSPLNILPNTADNIYMVMGGGDVGFGTITPTAKIHAVIAGAAPAIKLSNATYDTTIVPSGTSTLSELNSTNIGWQVSSTDGYFRLNRSAGLGPVLIYTNGTATGLALSGAVAGTEHMRITPTGEIGINTTDFISGPGGITNKLAVRGANGDTGYHTLSFFENSINPTVNNVFYNRSLTASIVKYGAFNTAQNTASLFTADDQGSGNVTDMYAMNSYALSRGSGTISNLITNYSDKQAQSGTIGIFASFVADCTQLSGGTITDMYGLLVKTPTNVSGGTRTNTYGVLLQSNTTGTNNYGFVSSGNMSNGLGTLTPSSQALLELVSTDKALIIMRMTAVQASAITPADGMGLYVTTTDATFLTVGFWKYEAGVWLPW